MYVFQAMQSTLLSFLTKAHLHNESPSAQNVVASIASDPNVWNDVLKNEALVEFLENHQSSVVFPEFGIDGKGSSTDESESTSESGNGFMDYVKDIKHKVIVTVVDMMNSLSDMFQTLFGGAPKGEFTVNPDRTVGISMEKTAYWSNSYGFGNHGYYCGDN
uniref:Uncharacterized protein n=1 Tax=Lactuca sativa TaxID=4236 RepID=A0A9R1UE10_LACSA|nr:hypothetical protein LSAT_V11C900459770 [Lactuca sativa]